MWEEHSRATAKANCLTIAKFHEMSSTGDRYQDLPWYSIISTSSAMVFFSSSSATAIDRAIATICGIIEQKGSSRTQSLPVALSCSSISSGVGGTFGFSTILRDVIEPRCAARLRNGPSRAINSVILSDVKRAYWFVDLA